MHKDVFLQIVYFNDVFMLFIAFFAQTNENLIKHAQIWFCFMRNCIKDVLNAIKNISLVLQTNFIFTNIQIF
jgi:hypothetical protein